MIRLALISVFVYVFQTSMSDLVRISTFRFFDVIFNKRSPERELVLFIYDLGNFIYRFNSVVLPLYFTFIEIIVRVKQNQ